MQITTSGREFYVGGTAGASALAGYETGTRRNRVVRFAFTVPEEGISRLSFRATPLTSYATPSATGELSYYITTSPTSHINAGAGFVSHGALSISFNGTTYDLASGTVSINLAPGATAYIYIFPNTANYFLWSFGRITALTVTADAGSSSIAAITQSVETLGTLTVTAGKTVDSFRHRLAITAGGQTLHLSEPFDTAYSVAVPREWFEGFPDTAVIEAEAVLTTYNGEAQVGAAATAAVTITADDGMRPTIADGWAAAAAYNEGAAAALTGYIAGYSRAEVSFDESKITQAVGAALASVTVSVSGAEVTSAPYRTPTLIGAAELLCTATDTRGRTASQSISIEPMDYAPPTLMQIRIARCTAAGVEAEDGSYYAAKATAVFSSLDGQNVLTLTAAHKVQGGVYGTETALASGTTSVIGQISPDSTYQVRLTATDSLGNTAVTVTTLPTRQWALKFRADGLGVAFGKAPEHSKAIELPEGWQIWIGNATIAESIAASVKQQVIDAVFPVGIYISLSADTDPATLWGGTWERLEEGRTIIAAGSTYAAGSTGGEAEHTLTVSEMPSHAHSIWYPNSGGSADAAIGFPTVGSKNTYYAESSKVGSTGDSAAHNNMPPYIAAYIWHRIG